MNKEQILDKYEKENRKMDEGQRREDARADLLSFLVVIVLSVFAVYINHNAIIFALVLGVLLTAYGCGEMYRFMKIKAKRHLLFGVIAIITGLYFYGTYIMNVLVNALELM